MDFQGFAETLEGRLDTSEDGTHGAREQDRVSRKCASHGDCGRERLADAAWLDRPRERER